MKKSEKQNDELFKQLQDVFINILFDANGTGSGAEDIVIYLKNNFQLRKKKTNKKGTN